MSALKVFLVYEEGDDTTKHMEVAVTVPKKWRPGPTSKLRDFAVETYDAKHADNAIGAPEAWHIEVSSVAEGGDPTPQPLGDADVIEQVIERKDRVLLKPGASAPGATLTDARAAAAEADEEAAVAARAAVAEAKAGQLRCKNYGCGQWFKEADNHDMACLHHASAPFFHDLKKGWSCCPDKIGYDWEEFQAIPGCVRSRHSTETPGASLAASKGQEARAAMCAAADAEAAAAPPAPAAPVLKSISSYNDANPDAATGAKSFGNSTGASAKPKVKRNADGSFRCQRKGCGKANARTDAGPVCIHHCGPPVFHETYKLWSCCPQQKKYDFDEFMKVPGCRIGVCWDGDGEEPESEPYQGGGKGVPAPAAAADVVEASEDGGFDL